MTDQRKLRTGKRPGVGGRPPLSPGEQTVRVQSRIPASEYAEFKLLAGDLNESQAILRAIRLWVAMARERSQVTHE